MKKNIKLAIQISLASSLLISISSDLIAKETSKFDGTQSNKQISRKKDKYDFDATNNATNVSVGGYLVFLSGFYDDNFDNVTDRDFLMSSEVTVTARHKTDKGIRYGASLQLLGSTDDDDSKTDEVRLWAHTKFGRLIVGDDDGPSDYLSFYAPIIGFGQGAVDSFGQAIESNYGRFLDRGSRSQIGPKALDSSDSTKVIYYTPRMQGFMFGVSYAPEWNEGESILRSANSELAQNGGASGNTAALNRQLIDYVQPNSDGLRNSTNNNASRGNPRRFFKHSYEDIVELGANFKETFEDIEFGLSGGYVMADQKTVANALDDRHNIRAWSVGTEVEWKQFRIGGSYVDNGKSGQLKSKTSQERNAWNVGLSYDVGQWGVGVNYLHEDLGGTSINGSGSYRALGLGGEYQLAPGIMLGADLVFFKRQFGEDPNNPGLRIVTAGVKPTESKDQGHVFLLGSRMDF